MADQKEFSKIRHEVYKFGLQGLDKRDQVSARYEQAIKLGAKTKSWIRPHKNLSEQREDKRRGSTGDDSKGQLSHTSGVALSCNQGQRPKSKVKVKANARGKRAKVAAVQAKKKNK